MPRTAENLKGREFGRLLVLSKAVTGSGYTAWRCRCACGKTKIITASSLRRGTQSCGCYQKERMTDLKTTHGMRGHPLYARWNMMIQRCENPNNKSFLRYGGRGIRVCRAWHTFETFCAWALANGFKETLWLERKNNNGNYSPGNCCWATLSEQARNRRPVKLSAEQVTELKTILRTLPRGGRTGIKKQLAARYGVSPTTIANIGAGDTHAD